MSKRNRKANRTRDATPAAEVSARACVSYLISPDASGDICIPGYIPLSKNPEIVSAVNKIASLIGSMTIHLMENGENGDHRVKDGLSYKVDIAPNRYMTRMTLVSWIIRTLMLEGNGNCVVSPRSHQVEADNYLASLEPVAANRVSFVPALDDYGYRILVDGREYEPDELLHFVLNPDANYPWRGTGYRVALGDIVANLAQAGKTKQGFMSSKWKPSLIVRVESNAEELATEEGRATLTRQYLTTGSAGEPWLIPAEMMDVQQIKPLSLTDLALNEAVQLDKKTVAAILGVPPYVVGAGEFHRDEWNSFVQATILPIVTGIQQELTRKIIFGGTRYFRFNPWSLYSYDISALANIGGSLFVRGIMTGNEVRQWIGQGPLEGLDELTILENYIPLDKIGDQLKLGGDDNA